MHITCTLLIGVMTGFTPGRSFALAPFRSSLPRAWRISAVNQRRLIVSPSSPLSSSSFSSGMTGGREPQKLFEEGRKVTEDALQVAREVGLRATVQRTVIGQRAIVETALELARELPIGNIPFRSVAGKPFEETVQEFVTSLPPELAPKTLRRLFERLGATYVKLGQFIASSPTIFPAEYVLEFQKCLDDTPAVDFSTLKGIVEKDLGRSITDVYSKFDETPLASASVAQVHAATLRTGEDVVVKVQKPGVADTLKADLGFIAVAGKVLEFLAPNLSRLSLANIVEDLRTAILGELDFKAEGKCLDEFRAFLVTNQLDGIATAPIYYPQASGTKVLTMERLYGVPLVDLENIKGMSDNPEETLINALNTWTLSVVACDFFHADVHAGNLIVLKDGRVGFIDFGIVGRIPPRIWTAIQDLAVGLASEDFKQMAEALVEMGATSKKVNVDSFAADLEKAVRSLTEITPQVMVTAGQDGSVAAAVGVDEQQVTRLALDLVAVAEGNGVRLPREFGILLKQVLYFDRYTRLLAPDLDVLADDRISLRNDIGRDFTDAIDVNAER